MASRAHVLGWHIRRQAWRSRTRKRAVYTYPSKKALASILDKVRDLTRRARHRALADLLRRLNPVLRGWCTYFRHGMSSRTFGYIGHFAFWRIVGRLRKRHVRLNMHTLVRRFLPNLADPSDHALGVQIVRPRDIVSVLDAVADRFAHGQPGSASASQTPLAEGV
jgi:RNA-directed DNA polymerase